MSNNGKEVVCNIYIIYNFSGLLNIFKRFGCQVFVGLFIRQERKIIKWQMKLCLLYGSSLSSFCSETKSYKLWINVHMTFNISYSTSYKQMESSSCLQSCRYNSHTVLTFKSINHLPVENVKFKLEFFTLVSITYFFRRVWERSEGFIDCIDTTGCWFSPTLGMISVQSRDIWLIEPRCTISRLIDQEIQRQIILASQHFCRTCSVDCSDWRILVTIKQRLSQKTDL